MRVVVWACVMLLLPVSVAIGKIYKWVERDGAVHFTDNPAAVPAQYRAQLESKPEHVAPTVTVRPTPQEKPVLPLPIHVPQSTVIPVRRVGNAMLVKATLNGFVTAPFLVDTGAAFTVISTTSARRLGVDLKRAAVIPMQSVSGSFLARLTKVRSLRVGGAEVDNVEVVVHDTTPGQEMGLLGMSFLDNFQVTISAASNAMRLTPLHEDVTANLVGGKPEDWWRRKFRFYRQQISMIDTYLSTKASPDLVQTRRYFRTELASLERQASHAAVPRSWRY